MTPYVNSGVLRSHLGNAISLMAPSWAQTQPNSFVEQERAASECGLLVTGQALAEPSGDDEPALPAAAPPPGTAPQPGRKAIPLRAKIPLHIARGLG